MRRSYRAKVDVKSHGRRDRDPRSWWLTKEAGRRTKREQRWEKRLHRLAKHASIGRIIASKKSRIQRRGLFNRSCNRRLSWLDVQFPFLVQGMTLKCKADLFTSFPLTVSAEVIVQTLERSKESACKPRAIHERQS